MCVCGLGKEGLICVCVVRKRRGYVFVRLGKEGLICGCVFTKRRGSVSVCV